MLAFAAPNGSVIAIDVPFARVLNAQSTTNFEIVDGTLPSSSRNTEQWMLAQAALADTLRELCANDAEFSDWEVRDLAIALCPTGRNRGLSTELNQPVTASGTRAHLNPNMATACHLCGQQIREADVAQCVGCGNAFCEADRKRGYKNMADDAGHACRACIRLGKVYETGVTGHVNKSIAIMQAAMVDVSKQVAIIGSRVDALPDDLRLEMLPDVIDGLKELADEQHDRVPDTVKQSMPHLEKQLARLQWAVLAGAAIIAVTLALLLIGLKA